MRKNHKIPNHNTTNKGDPSQDDMSDSECKAGIMRLFARALIRQAGLKSTNNKPLTILDNACGYGAVSEEIYGFLDSQAMTRMWLTCGDISKRRSQSN